MLEDTQIQQARSFADRDLGVLLDTKLTMSQQGTLCHKEGEWHPGFIRKSMASRLREVILLLYSALCPVLKCCVQVSAHQEKRDMATLFSLRKRRLRGILIRIINS